MEARTVSSLPTAAPYHDAVVRDVTQSTMKFFNQTRLANARLADDQH
jgi:hypothetical protein